MNGDREEPASEMLSRIDGRRQARKSGPGHMLPCTAWLRTTRCPAFAVTPSFPLALSRTHNLLNETLWEGASLRLLLEAELQPYAAGSQRTRLSGPDIDLPARLAVVLGMAFHELTTNAVKYGALSTASGQVAVDWKVDGAGEGTRLTLDWCELGGPKLEAEPSPGFGSRLLRQTIIRELAGQLDLRYEREGVCCTITVPIGSAGQQAA
jgi:two-component sensor histidine kinase